MVVAFACEAPTETVVDPRVVVGVDTLTFADAAGVEAPAVACTDGTETGAGTDTVGAVTVGTGAGVLGGATTPPNWAPAAAGIAIAASRPQMAARINRPTPNGLLRFMFLPFSRRARKRALLRLQREIDSNRYGSVSAGSA